MTNFTLAETLVALWECPDDSDARELVDTIVVLLERITVRNIPHPFT